MRTTTWRSPRYPCTDRPLRVGVIAPPFLPVPPPGYGGTERVVGILCEGLVGRGHDVTLFAAPGSVTSARLVTPLETAPTLGDPSSVPEEFLYTTAAYLRADAFDVIHDHSGMGPALGSMLAGRPPVVHTLHGPWTPYSQRFIGLVDDRVHVVAISRAQQADNPFIRYAGMVYNGVDLRAHPFNADKEEFLVYLGRVSPEKRPEQAIDVARRSGRPLVMIVKRSEPAERNYWDHMVAPRLGSDVEVMEEPPDDVKVDVLGRAKALIFPIDWPEPFGLVMTEAMACGTPVIARRLGAAPEVIAHGVTGLLCDSLDDMVDAVAGIGSLRPVDCRRRAEQHFSADAMACAYERIYATAIGERDDVPGRHRTRPHVTPAYARPASDRLASDALGRLVGRELTRR